MRKDEAIRIAHGLHFMLRRVDKIDAATLATLRAGGMLMLRQLRDGASYYGWCRNGTVGRWAAATERFTYERHKFSRVFDETICHPERDNGFDLFVPVLEVGDAE